MNQTSTNSLLTFSLVTAFRGARKYDAMAVKLDYRQFPHYTRNSVVRQQSGTQNLATYKKHLAASPDYSKFTHFVSSRSEMDQNGVDVGAAGPQMSPLLPCGISSSPASRAFGC